MVGSRFLFFFSFFFFFFSVFPFRSTFLVFFLILTAFGDSNPFAFTQGDDPFASSGGDPFASPAAASKGGDPFSSAFDDPFSSSSTSHDPFGASGDPFASSAAPSSSGFGDDSFGSSFPSSFGDFKPQASGNDFFASSAAPTSASNPFEDFGDYKAPAEDDPFAEFDTQGGVVAGDFEDFEVPVDDPFAESAQQSHDPFADFSAPKKTEVEEESAPPSLPARRQAPVLLDSAPPPIAPSPAAAAAAAADSAPVPKPRKAATTSEPEPEAVIPVLPPRRGAAPTPTTPAADPFASFGGSSNDPFAASNSDPFATNTSDPFATNDDPFASHQGETTTFDEAFGFESSPATSAPAGFAAFASFDEPPPIVGRSPAQLQVAESAKKSASEEKDKEGKDKKRKDSKDKESKKEAKEKEKEKEKDKGFFGIGKKKDSVDLSKVDLSSISFAQMPEEKTLNNMLENVMVRLPFFLPFFLILRVNFG